MKKSLLIVGLLVSSFGFSQTEDETVTMVIDNYIENIGGADAISKIEGVKMVAEVEAQGMSIPVEIYQMNDGRKMTIIEVQGMELVQDAFDGEVAWGTSFMTGQAEESDEETSENTKRSAKHGFNPFYNYKEKGITLSYEGMESIDGVECYKIKMNAGKILVDGEEIDDISYTYFDSENFVPIMSSSEMHSGPSAGETAITTFSDYEEVDGVYFPFSMVSGVEGGMEQAIDFDEIIVNPDTDDVDFSFPGN